MKDHLQKLMSAGVIEIVDGTIYLTRKAWRAATDSTKYAEPHETVHFVGFKNDRYLSAVKVFGKPDFIHRFWDRRAVDEVMEGDVVVFADGDETQPVNQYAYDDSAYF
jgi:hypothetical protein